MFLQTKDKPRLTFVPNLEYHIHILSWLAALSYLEEKGKAVLLLQANKAAKRATTVWVWGDIFSCFRANQSRLSL